MSTKFLWMDDFEKIFLGILFPPSGAILKEQHLPLLKSALWSNEPPHPLPTGTACWLF